MLASPAAIKLMHPAGPGKTLDASAAERFRREARVTAALRSPHTVHLYDFGAGDDGTFFFAMELLEGIDLAALVRRFGPQPAERVRASCCRPATRWRKRTASAWCTATSSRRT